MLFFGFDGTRKTGNVMRNASAVYDLRRKRWKRTTPPPFHPAILQPNAVWTGRDLVVVGVSCHNRATPQEEDTRCYPGTLVSGAYDPVRDRWRRIPVPEALAAGFTPGNEGASGESIGALDGQAIFSISRQFWSVDPRTEQWKHAAAAPAYSACVAGRSLIAESASAVSVVDMTAGTTSEVSAVPAIDPPGPFVFVCGDDAVYAYTMVLTSAWRYDLDARVWEELPTPPQPTAFVSTGGWTGRDLLISISIRSRDPVTTTKDGFAFDPATNAWRTTPDAIVAGGAGGQAWSDGCAFQLGYEPSGKVMLQTYRPG